MALLSVSMLGGFRARLASGSDLELPRKKAQAVLGYLSLRPEQRCLRDKLASLFWGDVTDEQARHNLRQTLFTLRNALPAAPPILLSDGESVAFAPGTVDVDAVTFARLASESNPAALAEAATLYQGNLLDGFAVDEAPFEEWLRAERERFHELALEVLTKLLAHQRKGEALEPAIQTALRLLTLDPFQEVTHRSLMRLYARQGRRAAALRQYQLCVDVLRRELAAEPEAATRQLYQEILGDQGAIARPEAFSALEVHRKRRGVRLRRRPSPVLETPLIGRDEEMDRLRQSVQEAWRRRGGVAVILGEAGVGKTRLAEELCTLARRRGGMILIGRSYETSQVLPFGPWIDALRAEVSEASQSFKGLDAVWRAELGRLFPELKVPEPASTGGAMRLFEALTQAVAWLAGRQPVLLIIEDLHWADEMSLRFFAFLARQVSNLSVLLVATAREEELPDAPLLGKSLEELRHHSGLREVQLRPLSRDNTVALVRSHGVRDKADPLSERLEQRVWTVSEGNPFLALETLRALQLGTTTEGELPLPIPRRVREFVLARLERLSERGRRLVAAASVIGREFDFRLLQHVAALGDRESAQAVDELICRRVLHCVGESLDFVHEHVREVALGQVLPPQRKPLHRLVARAIEEVYASQLDRHCATLATHYQEGEVWDKALQYLRHAATQATARSAFRQAESFLTEGLEALRHLPETLNTLEQGIDIRCELRSVLIPLYTPSFQHLEEARRLADRLGDRVRLARVLGFLSREHIGHGDLMRAITCAEDAVTAARAANVFEAEIGPSIVLGEALRFSGQLRRSIDILQAIVEAVGEREYPEHWGTTGSVPVAARYHLTAALVFAGDFADALRHAEDMLRIAESTSRPWSLTQACLALGRLYNEQGDFHSAMRFLERGLAVSHERDVRIHLYMIRACLGIAYAYCGRLTEALALRDEAVGDLGIRPGFDTDRFRDLALISILVGQLDEAEAFARRCLDQARAFGQRVSEARSLLSLGDLAMRREPPKIDEAESSYRQALALAEEMEARPLAGLCHLALGVLDRHLGRTNAARAQLATAAGSFRTMKMTRWLASAEGALSECRS